MRKSFRFQTLFVRGITLFFWMLTIFILSALPGSGTGYEPPLWYVLERKSAHVFEYAVLMWLSFRFARSVFAEESFRRILLLAGAFSLTFAASDELHQLFVFGRGGRMTDVMIDGGGILLMAGMITFFWKRYATFKQE